MKRISIVEREAKFCLLTKTETSAQKIEKLHSEKCIQKTILFQYLFIFLYKT